MAEKINLRRHSRTPRLRSIKSGPEHKLLNVFIGKWIDEGHTEGTGDAATVKIVTSDVYEWARAGFSLFTTHIAS
jgi:hypothetical protein